jgi:hypothetical protein
MSLSVQESRLQAVGLCCLQIKIADFANQDDPREWSGTGYIQDTSPRHIDFWRPWRAEILGHNAKVEYRSIWHYWLNGGWKDFPHLRTRFQKMLSTQLGFSWADGYDPFADD